MNYSELSNISIKKYLADRNIHPAKDHGHYGMYHSPFREDRNPSFKVDYNDNVWIDFGTDEGGSIVQLVMKIENCSYDDAKQKLESGDISSTINPDSFTFQNNKVPKTKAIIIVDIKPLTHKALIGYLNKRGINSNVAKAHCKEVHYSIKEKNYFAIGFENDEEGYELRNSKFKGCTSKAITTISDNKDTCIVFEGFMDYLSYLTMHDKINSSHDVVILNSVALLKKAMDFIKSHAKVHTYLDNDNAGKEATLFINRECKEHINKSTRYAKFKDLNDYLCKRIKPNLNKTKGLKR